MHITYMKNIFFAEHTQNIICDQLLTLDRVSWNTYQDTERCWKLMTDHSRINVYHQPARTRGSRFIALHIRE